MNFQNFIHSWVCGGNDCYPYPSSNHTETGWYIPLTSQPPPALPMRVLPLSLTNRDYHTAQEIHAFLLQAPLQDPPDLTTDITATFSLPAEAYTPRLAEYLLLAVETTVEAAPWYDWYKGQRNGFGDAFFVAREAASDPLRASWQIAESEWHETGKYASDTARIVKTVLALAILARIAPGFTRALGFESSGAAKGEQPLFFFFLVVVCCCCLVTLASLSYSILSPSRFFAFYLLFVSWHSTESTELTEGRVVCGSLDLVDSSYFPSIGAVGMPIRRGLIGADMRLEICVRIGLPVENLTSPYLALHSSSALPNHSTILGRTIVDNAPEAYQQRHTQHNATLPVPTTQSSLMSGVLHSCPHGSRSPANQGEPGEPG